MNKSAIQPSMPSNFIFMKVGRHAEEEIEDILERKLKEIDQVGYCLWGYGGSCCHPVNQVQPFAKQALEREGRVYLLMQTINSNANPQIKPATEMSTDGKNWQPIPKEVIVTGSKWAIVLDELKPGDLQFDIAAYTIGIGPSKGKNASDYVVGRVDKACLELSTNANSGPLKEKKRADFVGRMRDPYAVFVRGN